MGLIDEYVEYRLFTFKFSLTIVLFVSNDDGTVSKIHFRTKCRMHADPLSDPMFSFGFRNLLSNSGYDGFKLVDKCLN